MNIEIQAILGTYGCFCKFWPCSFPALCWQKSRNASHFNDLFSNSVIIIVCTRLHQNSIYKPYAVPVRYYAESTKTYTHPQCTIRIHVQMKHTYCICFSYLLKSQHTLASAVAHWTCFRLHKIDAFILLGRANVHHSGPFYIYQLFSILNSCWCFSLLLFSFLASSTSNSSCIIDDNTDHSRTQKLNRQWKRDRESKTKNKIHQPHIIYT